MVRDYCYPKCGDGMRVPHEQCDDGNSPCSTRLLLGKLSIVGGKSGFHRISIVIPNCKKF